MASYNYSDDYYKNFNKGTNPRNPFNPEKILGEGPVKEFYRKTARPILQSAGRIATGPAGQATGALAGGYLLGTAIDQGYRVVPGSEGMTLSENIAEGMMPVDDGKYNPDRPVNPLFAQARANQVERAMAEGVTPYMTTEQKTLSDFNQAMSPLGASTQPIKNAGFNVPIENTLPQSDSTQLNQQNAIQGFNKIMSESGVPQKTMEQTIEDSKVINAQGNIDPRKLPIDDPRRGTEFYPNAPAPYKAGVDPNNIYGNILNAPITNMSNILQNLPEDTPIEQRLDVANKLISPYLRQGDEITSNQALASTERDAQEKTPSKLDMYMGDMGMSGIQQLSMNDYKNIAKGMLPEGTSRRVRSAYAKKLKRDDQLGRFDKNYARAIEQKKMQLDEAYRNNQITRQDRDHELNLMKFAANQAIAKEEAERKAAELTRPEIISRGNDAMATMKKFMNNPSADNVLDDEVIDDLINFNSSFKVGEANPIATLNLPDVVLQDALYGSKQIVPFFRDGQATPSAIEQAKEQGFEYVYREEDGDFKPYYVEPALKAHYEQIQKDAKKAEEEEQKVVQLGGPFGGFRL